MKIHSCSRTQNYRLAGALRLLGILMLSLATVLGGTVSWTGGGGDSLWTNPANWSGGRLPEAGDDVVINSPGALTVVLESGWQRAKSVRCENSLSITGGYLALRQGASWVRGTFVLEAGRLLVAEEGTSFIATGMTRYEGGYLEANGGATVDLPELKSISDASSNVHLTASDAGSELRLPEVTTATIEGNMSLWVWDGGQIQLPKLATLLGGVDAYAEGQDSRIDLSGFSGELGGGSQSYLEARSDGTIHIPNVTRLDRVNLTIKGTGQIPLAQVTALRRGGLTLDDSSRSLPGLADVTGSHLEARNGANLGLTGVTQLASTSQGFLALSAWDPDSVLSLPNVTRAVLSAEQTLWIEANQGGRVELPKLTGLEGGFSIYADGDESVIDLSGFRGVFTGGTQTGYIESRDGSAVMIPNVSAIERVRVRIRGSGHIPLGQLTGLRDGELELDEATLALPGLTDISGSSLKVLNGAKLTLAGVTQWTYLAHGYPRAAAAGGGSVLSLPNLTHASLPMGGVLMFDSEDGGWIQVGKLASLEGNIDAYANGEGSRIDLSGFKGSFGSWTSNRSHLEARSGSAILIPNVTALDRVRLILRGTGQMPLSQVTAFRRGELLLDGVVLSLPALADITDTDLTVLNGGRLTLGNVTELASRPEANLTFSAFGAGSVLSLPNVTRLAADSIHGLRLQAGEGGQIQLPKLATPQPLELFAEGTGSLIDLSAMTGTLGQMARRSYVEVRDGASILLPNVTAMENVRLIIRRTGSVPTSQLERVTGSTVIIDAARVNFGSLAETTGTTFEYLNGGTVVFALAVDLAVSAIQAPATAIANQPVEVSWQIANIGAALENGAWTDALFLSQDAVAGNDHLLALLPASGSLASGASRRFTNTVIFPAERSGNWRIVVVANHSRTVFEGANTSNNTNISAATIQIQAPDLVVSSVTAQPTPAVLGQSITVTWTVLNSGSARTQGDWVDQVWLSRSGGTTELIPLGTQPATGGLAAGASYTRSATIQLPLLPNLTAGAYSVVVETDRWGAVDESLENNNTRGTALNVTLPPLPDLSVTQLTFPGTAVPGQPVSFNWTINNLGSAVARGGWTEALMVRRAVAGAEARVISLTQFDSELAIGSFALRTRQVLLPSDLAAGTYECSVTADYHGELLESSKANNQFTATPRLQAPAVLQLQLPISSIAENATPPPVSALLLRNGDLANPLTVSMSNDSLGLLKTAASVTIPAGQASVPVELTTQPDGIPAPDRLVTITAKASGYSDGVATITVRNTDLPKLRLQLASSTVPEGLSVQATVSHDAPQSSAVAVSLSSPNRTRLQLPEKVVIPAGQSSVNFLVVANDDTLVEADLQCTIQASAPGFAGASATLTVTDNDLASLTLSLAASTVSEGAGLEATRATVSRGVASPRSLTVDINNSNPAAVTVPSHVVIPAGQASVSFPVGTVNNDVVDGTKTAVLQAFARATVSGVWVASSLPVTLTITDDDGPALRLALGRDLVAGDLAVATTVTVTRNGATTQALAVFLSSSDPGRATVPAQVTLAAGQSTASVSLTTLRQPPGDGSHVIVITAEAAGYASARGSLTVTDINKPDLIVKEVTGPESAETEAYVNVSYRVFNQGLAPAGTNWVTRVFLSKAPVAREDMLLVESVFNGSLPVGQYFGQTRQVRMPMQPGDYWVVVSTDVMTQISEVIESNNTTISARPIRLVEAYRATVQADIDRAPAGTTVPLRGTATKTSTGGPAPFALVNLHLHVRGTHRIISALADQAGRFSANFTPLPGEAGLYEIGAAHPGLANAPIQDFFTLVGIKAGSAPTLKVAEGSSLAGQVAIENLGDQRLTGLAVTVVSHAPNLSVTATLSGNSLPGAATMQLGFAVAASDRSVVESKVLLRVTSLEGATLDVPVAVTVESIEPRLVARPSQLQAGMKVGGQAFVTFTVVNEGASPSAPIHVTPPSLPWLNVATDNPLPPLAPGASHQVTLQLRPAADLPLGNYDGMLVIKGGARDENLPFSFRALSEAKGDLKVSAVDEYTYYAEGAPKVSGAVVTVLDAVTDQVVIAGFTDDAGEFRAPQLPEGYYEIKIKAEDHKDYREIHLVKAGFENNVVAFLPRIAVRYIWTVTPTEIQDRTKITIESVFEAFVPMPVVTIDPALIDLDDFSADITQIDLRITNHGLVAAQKAKLSFDTHPNWSFTPLISDLGDLPARSTLVVPLLIRKTPTLRLMFAKASLQSGGGGGGCGAGGSLQWELPCGAGSIGGGAGVAMVNAGGSGCGGGGVGWGGGGGPGGGEMPISGGWGASSSSQSAGSCDPCMLEALKCLINFVLPDVASCVKNSLSCVASARDGLSWESAGNCVDAILACAKAAGKESLGKVGKAISAIKCAINLSKACGAGSGGGGSGGGGDGPGGEGGIGGQGGAKLGLSAAANSFRLMSPAQPFQGGAQTAVIERAELTILRQRAEWLDAEIAGIRYLFGDDSWFVDESPTALTDWLENFLVRIDPVSDQGRYVSGAESAQLLTLPLPLGVTLAVAQGFIERWNRSIEYWANGIFDQNQVPAGYDPDFLALDVLLELGGAAVNAAAEYAAAGYTSADAAFRQSYADLENFLSEGDGDGVCAQVRIRIDQELVSTRDAFDATLEIENMLSQPIEELAVEVRVRHRNGDDASSVFAIFPPSLAGISAIDGRGTLDGKAVGKVHWLLVPTTEAAVQGPEEFLISGVLRYRQGQLRLTVPLAPAKVMVHPSPSLQVKYFHQREVFADDPFTTAIEPSVPFSLAVMVQNKGHGAARDVRITSAQPKIIENDKGLLVDFKIIATEVAGRNIEPTLTVDFGQINPGTNAIGRWLLTSTLLGGFVEYSATVQHLNGLGDKKLSLVEGVSIHELIQVVRAPGARDDGRPDFLVNDVADLYHRPDTVHLSDGKTERVSVVTEATVDGEPEPGRLEIALTASCPAGFVYLRRPNPGGDRFHLVRVVRSDGVEISVGENAWTTDRTFLGNARRPVVEHTLHLFDWNSTGRYTLIYAAVAGGDTVPPSSAVAALPSESTAIIPLTWSGEDNPGGSGVLHYDIYVSVDSGPFTRWIRETIDRSAQYQGALGKSYAFYSIATDQAGNREAAPMAADAQTQVTRINRPPVLDLIPDQAIREGETLVVKPVATDPDSDSLVFSLKGDAPPGVALEPYTGLITWVTGPGNGPSVNQLTLEVLDNGLPRMGAVRSFTVTVTDVNTPPVLASIPDQTVAEGEPLVIAAQAWDIDLPRQTLTYSFGAPAPAGAALDPATGVFTWLPADHHGGISYRIAIKVSDNGTPSLSATQEFNVFVLDTRSDFTLALGSTHVVAGQSAELALELTSGADLNELSFLLSVTDAHLVNLELVSSGTEVIAASLDPLGHGFFGARLRMDPARTLSGTRAIGRLQFGTVASGVSAAVRLEMRELTGARLGGTEIANASAQPGRVFVIENEPLLDAKLNLAGGGVSLMVFGKPGARYRLERAPSLSPDATWATEDRFDLQGTSGQLTRPVGASGAAYYRLVAE
jgi:hypothetical protein